jgi:acyl carrier protein
MIELPELIKRLNDIVGTELGMDVILDHPLPVGSFDSLDYLELIIAIEEEFDVCVSDEEAEMLLAPTPETGVIPTWQLFAERLHSRILNQR